MPATVFSFEETPESRAETYSPPSYTLIYKASGEVDNEVVSVLANSGTPQSVFLPVSGTLYRRDVRIDPLGHALYLVTVTYGTLDFQSLQSGEATFSFDTQGATIKIKAAKSHVATYKDGTGIPASGAFHNGAIQVNEDGEAEGADIVVPALKLTYSFRHSLGVVDENFAKTIAFATGRTNNNVWHTFKPGELLFIGGSGTDGTQSEATVTYNFIAIPNETNYTIGGIAGVVKEGHHYAWVEFEDKDDDGEAFRRVKYVHIERVYDAINFSTVFGF